MERLIDANKFDVIGHTLTGDVAYDNGYLAAIDRFEEMIDDAPTIPAITIEWMDAKIRGYASALKSTELKALVLVKQMWEREQEART